LTFLREIKMATITTSGQVNGILSTEFSQFDGAISNVGLKLDSTLYATANDVYYGNYYFLSQSENRFDLQLLGVNGVFTLIGSGFYSSRPKITDTTFIGADGFRYGLHGSISINAYTGAESGYLKTIEASWQDDSMSMSGNLKLGDYGDITGKVSTLGIHTSAGLALTLGGSISLSSEGESGTYKSVNLRDDLGNSIDVKGSFSVSTWNSEQSLGLTVDDLFNSSVLFAGSDTFNVPDAARPWHGFAGNDKMYGGGLADELHGDDGNDKIYGYAGNDILVGGNGNDFIDGGAGNDTILGGAGNDKIVDTYGDNLIIDDLGNANVTVGDGNDTIITGSGNDKIVAGNGANQIDAGDGNNKVTSLSGDDQIFTGGGNDNINAGEGNNSIYAGAGNDKVVTGSGNDILVSGAGSDNLTGGLGIDSYVFDNLAQGGADTITGFVTLSDVLVFDDAVFTSLVGGVASTNLVVGAGAVAQDSDDYLIFNTKGGKLYYDADGSGAGGAIQIATLKSVTSLNVSDFVVEHHTVV